MMNTKRILLILEEMADEWYPEPVGYYHKKKEDFITESYKHTCIMLLIELLIINDVNDNPVKILEAHKKTLKTIRNKDLFFEIYYAMTVNILDCIYASAGIYDLLG